MQHYCLELYANGTKLATATVIDDNIQNLEVRFSEYKIDTQYNYQNVKVYASSSRGTDTETFSLANTGTFYSHTFRQVTGNANPGDGILQHQNPDSIICVFKNGDLPLDTLRICFPYSGNNVFAIQNGTYFDTDADGLADSIAFAISGQNATDFTDTILKSIRLPAWRQFTITNKNLSGNIISLKVKQGLVDKITSVEKDDIFSIDTVHLSPDATLLPAQFPFIDSMAPVIVTAHCIDSAKITARDKLLVTFSENAGSTTKTKPFYFVTHDGLTSYNAQLSLISQSGKQAGFAVVQMEVVPQIKENDSVWIAADIGTNISDIPGNNQDNVKNIRVPISVEVIPDGVAIINGSYFDKDADGKVDYITYFISGQNVESYKDKIFNAITLPPWRQFTINNKTLTGSTIVYFVKQGLADRITSVEKDDIFSISDTVVLSSDIKLLPSKFTYTDSMAPVITKAHCIDSAKIGAKDYLIITFSEPAQPVLLPKPFYFVTRDGKTRYIADLANPVFNNTIAFFEIKGLDKVASIKENDSVWIAPDIGKNVFDALSNNQSNPNNIRQPISLETIYEGISIRTAAYYDRNADGHVDRINLLLYGIKIETYLDTIVKSLILPAYRQLSISKYMLFNTNTILLDVVERNTALQTSVIPADVVVIPDTITLPDNLSVLPCKVSIADSMAPVITRAELVDVVHIIKKGKTTEKVDDIHDSLTVYFSETTGSIADSIPFQFFTVNNTVNYQASMRLIGAAGAQSSFIIQSVKNASKINGKDSICISWGALFPVADTLHLAQKNSQNVRQEINSRIALDTIKVQLPYTLVLRNTLVSRTEGIPISKEFIAAWQGNTVLQTCPKNGDRYCDVGVFMIVADPDSNVSEEDFLEATLSLYDPLGNCVLKNAPMVFDNNSKKCVYVWDSRNINNRSAGGCAYFVSATVNCCFNNKLAYTKKLRSMLGVKE